MIRKSSDVVNTKQREILVWNMIGEGHTQVQVAEQLGIHQSTVSKIIKRLTQRAMQSLNEEVQEEIIIQLFQLRILFSEAVQEWKRSKTPQRVVTKRVIKGEEEITTVVRDALGDNDYLEQAQKILRDIRVLLDLERYAPALLNVQVSWKIELKEMLDAGMVTEGDIWESLGNDLASEFFEQNGPVSFGPGDVKKESI